jgi:hypothetical protein
MIEMRFCRATQSDKSRETRQIIVSARADSCKAMARRFRVSASFGHREADEVGPPKDLSSIIVVGAVAVIIHWLRASVVPRRGCTCAAAHGYTITWFSVWFACLSAMLNKHENAIPNQDQISTDT